MWVDIYIYFFNVKLTHFFIAPFDASALKKMLRLQAILQIVDVMNDY